MDRSKELRQKSPICINEFKYHSNELCRVSVFKNVITKTSVLTPIQLNTRLFKGSYFLRNRHFVIQERFNKLIYIINIIIKFDHLTACKISVSLSFFGPDKK